MTASMGGECDADGIRMGLAVNFAAEFAGGITAAALMGLIGGDPTPYTRAVDAALARLRSATQETS